MKLALLADGSVGAKFARFLLDKYPDDLSLIVTTQINDIYREAVAKGIRACNFETEEKVLEQIESGVDLGILAWWPYILKTPLLEAPRMGFVNTHPSLLPHNRGKHYNFWALVEQAPFGVSLHEVDAGVDSGAIISQLLIDYGWCDTGETLYYKAQAAMLQLLTEIYPALRKGQITSTPQDGETGSFHRASELESASKIDLDKNYLARELLNLLRARTFEGHPGCWFDDGGSRYEIAITIRKVR